MQVTLGIDFGGIIYSGYHADGTNQRYTFTSPVDIQAGKPLSLSLDGSMPTSSSGQLDRIANACESIARFQGNVEKAIAEEFTYLRALCDVQKEEIDRLNLLLKGSREGGESELSS